MASITVLHIADGSDDNFRVIPTDVANNATQDALRTFTVTNADDMQSLVFDGTNFHVTNWQESTVIVFSPSGSVVRTYTVTGISQPSGMAFDGTNLHISDRATDNIRVISPNTPNGDTATIIRTYSVDGLDDCRAMTFDGTNIHAADYSDDNIRIFAPNHTSGDAADLTYTVAGLNEPRAVAFDGTNLHLSDVGDGNFRVIAIPTTGGAQTVLRTYEVTDLDNPRGMTSATYDADEPNAPEISEGGKTETSITIDIVAAAVDFPVTDWEYELDGSGTWTSFGSTTLEQTISGLTAGTEYSIKVRGVNFPGNGTASAALTITTDGTPPTLATATITFNPTTFSSNQTGVANIVFNQAVNGLGIDDLSLDVGTLGSSVQGSGNAYTVQVTAPAGNGQMTLTLRANAVDEGNAETTGSANYGSGPPPPSTKSIAMVADQTLVVETMYRLTVGITGDPTNVEVRGDMLYFSHDWEPGNDRVVITGTPEVEFTGEWYIEARYSDGTVLTRDANFQVVAASPVFGTLPDIHLYRDVPINVEIPVINAEAVSGETLLLGLGIRRNDLGNHIIDGEIGVDKNFTETNDNFELAAAHVGGAVEHNYPYIIESGAPPALGTPEILNYLGDHAEVEVPDLANAISYNLRIGEDGPWYKFGDNYPQIDKRNLKVTPGNLSVTVTFPVVSGANSYQYGFGEDGLIDHWETAEATIANNMVSIVIPDLIEGQTTKVYFRVGEPWQSVPVSEDITGGRLVYAVHVNTSDRANNYLYIFHTGHANGATATRIKRLLLPTALTYPDRGGIAVDGDLVYILNMIANTDEALYIFDHTNFDDGDRMTQTRRNPMPAGYNGASALGMDKYENELYLYLSGSGGGFVANDINVVSSELSNGTNLSRIRNFDLGGAGHNSEGLSVTAESIFAIDTPPSNVRYLESHDRDSGVQNWSRELNRTADAGHQTPIQNAIGGFSMVGDDIYLFESNTDTFKRLAFNNVTNQFEQIWSINPPSGLTNPVRMDIEV